MIVVKGLSSRPFYGISRLYKNRKDVNFPSLEIFVLVKVFILFSGYAGVGWKE